MSLDKHYINTLPFLLESDVLSLSSDLTLEGTRLCDPTVGARHTIQTAGARVITLLQEGLTWQSLQDRCPANVSEMQLADLIGFLNTIGCLKRNRAITFYPRAWCKQLVHGIHGVWYQPLRRRGHTSLAAITHGIGRATVPVTLATLLTLGLLVCLLPSQAAPIIAKGGFVWLAFICSMVLHEYGHFKSIKHYRVGCDVLQYGMHIGLIHGKLPSLAEIYVAIAGPFCGIVACSLFIVLAMYALPGTPLLILFVGILHLCSLLPWYGDGKSLRLAHNQRKKANEIRTHSS